MKEAPDGDQWLHEIKYDGFRMHARLDRGEVRLLTRNGLDWTAKYPQIAAAVAALPARQAYLDGELCGMRPDGITSFSMIQLASDAGNAAGLVFFLFDLLYLDGEDLTARPLLERKERLAGWLSEASSPLQYSDHQIGLGPAFYEKACRVGSRRHRLQTCRCAVCPRQSRFVAQGQVPQPRRIRGDRLDRSRRRAAVSRRAAARLLRSRRKADLCRPGRHRHQPGRTRAAVAAAATTRRDQDAARRAAAAFDPLRLAAGLARVHWVRPELVAEVKFLTWTENNLLRQVVYEGLREDKPAAEVRREVPHPKAHSPAAATKSKRRSIGG